MIKWQLLNDLMTAIREKEKKTNAYDAEATVTRVEGKTAWVMIPGGDKETPIRMTIAAKTGDNVQIRVSGHRAWMNGNASRPPTDDATANAAKTTADQALKRAVMAAEVSEAAQEAAENSISADTLHYLATSLSSGVTIATSGWTTETQTMTPTNKYLWTYHTYTLANGKTINTTPVMTGRYGEDGADGTSVSILGSYDSYAELVAAHPTGTTGDAYLVDGDLYVWNGSAWEDVGAIKGDDGAGISRITSYYLATSAGSGVTPSTSGWTQAIQTTTTTNIYLWNYEVIEYTDGSTQTVEPRIIGTHGATGPRGATGATGAKGDTGATGATGIGVSVVQPQYYLSTSQAATTGGSWSTSLTWSSGYYIWTREQVTYTDGNTAYTTEIYDQALTEACALSYDTAQYFWVNDSGTQDVPTGAYVTEIAQDTYKTNPALGAVLLRSGGVYIRQAAATIAQFLSSGMTLFNSAGDTLAEFLSSGVKLYGNGVMRMKVSSDGLDVYGSDGSTIVAHLGYDSGKDAITKRADTAHTRKATKHARQVRPHTQKAMEEPAIR